MRTTPAPAGEEEEEYQRRAAGDASSSGSSSRRRSSSTAMRSSSASSDNPSTHTHTETHTHCGSTSTSRRSHHLRRSNVLLTAALALSSVGTTVSGWAFLRPQTHTRSSPTTPRTAATSARRGSLLLPSTSAPPTSTSTTRLSSWDPLRCHTHTHTSTRLYAVDVDEDAASGAPPPPPTPTPPAAAPTTTTTTLPPQPLSESDRLTLKSQMLKLQAEKLRLEAEKEQIKMEREALLKKQKRQQDTDRLIEKFRAVPKGTTTEDADLVQIVRMNLRNIDSDTMMRIRELAGESDSPEQALAYKILGDSVLKAVTDLDGRLAKEIREDLAFRLRDQDRKSGPGGVNAPFDQFAQVQDALRNVNGSSSSLSSNNGPLSTSSIDQLTQEMMRNNSRGFSTIYAINLPQWLPREFMRTLESFEPLLDEDVKTLRTEVFKMDTFFVTDVDKTPLAVAYMGTLRKPSDEVYQDVERRLQAIEGLKDRVQLFLFENPRPQMQEMGGMGGGLDDENPEVMFMAVSTRVKPLPVGGGQVTLSLLSLGATAFNALIYSILTFYTPADIVNKLGEEPLARLNDALPIAVGILGIQLAHDLAHTLAAKAKDIKLGVPVYIPSLQVGTFGSVLRFVSFPKSRKDMFDVAMAGPLVGIALSLAAFAAGMSLTNGAAPEVSAEWPMLPVALFRSSLLLWQLGQALFGPDVVNLPLVSQIHVHPLAIIGALGMLSQALQSMPIGRLDGGRATTSVFGRKAATFLSASLVLYQVVSGIILGNSLQLFWGTVVIIFQNAQEMYARDEITPVDGNRRNLLLLLWLVAALTLLPGVPWRDVGVFDEFSNFT